MRKVKAAFFLILGLSLTACEGCSGESQVTNEDVATEAEPVKEDPTDTLKIQDLTTGSGDEAKGGKIVSVYYTGRLTDGNSRTVLCRCRGGDFYAVVFAGRGLRALLYIRGNFDAYGSPVASIAESASLPLKSRLLRGV